MPLQRMPAAELALRVGSDIEWPDHPIGTLDPSYYLRSPDMAIVEAQLPASLYYESPQDLFDFRKDFGLLRMPFPRMWFEWTLPDTFRAGSETISFEHAAGARIAVLLDEVPAMHGVPSSVTRPIPEHFNRIDVRVYARYPQRPGSLTLLPVMRSIFVDEGRYITSINMNVEPHRSSPTEHEPHPTRFYPAFLALSLMNCKNVTTERAGMIVHRGPKPRGRHRREVARLDFHTIVLPGMSGARPGTAEYDEAMSRHRVRGHFKTYTEESPLFGKNVGTYWWGWQVRGDVSAGITTTDYRIEQSR